VNLADEEDLRRRLHAEVDLAEVGPLPAEAVFRRSRAARTWRVSAVASAMAVITVAVAVAIIRAPGRPAGRPAGLTAPPGAGVFAAGVANGRRWSLAAVNLANVRPWCLPGVVVNGQDGDLLQPGFLQGMAIGNVAFLAVSPGRPGAGFAFLRLRPGVSDVTASLGDGTRLDLRPVTVSVCGQSFRLAGFRWPPQGVTRITARSARGQRVSYAPPAAIFDPASALQSGTWVNLQGATGTAAAGEIGTGWAGGAPWRMDVALGPGGECFTAQAGQPGALGSATICAPVSAPPRGAALTSVPYSRPSGVVAWYMGIVNGRTAYARARFSSGRTIRLVPVLLGGRLYVAMGAGPRVRLARLTLYGAGGQVLAVVTDVPGGPPAT
jgi:hypothetical protein